MASSGCLSSCKCCYLTHCSSSRVAVAVAVAAAVAAAVAVVAVSVVAYGERMGTHVGVRVRGTNINTPTVVRCAIFGGGREMAVTMVI